VLFAHVEGAAWNFLDTTRYDSWAELGAPPPQPPAGTPAQDQGLPMRDHTAVHHDTIATFVSGGQPIRCGLINIGNSLKARNGLNLFAPSAFARSLTSTPHSEKLQASRLYKFYLTAS
jgi:hypothetical protein